MLFARMKLIVDLAQATAGYVCINLCGADACMAKEFLDNAEVSTIL